MVATSYIWLLSTWDVASISNLVYFTQFRFEWPHATVWDSSVLDTCEAFPLKWAKGGR